MRYFIDTEFIEYPGHIELLSIGIVSGDNRELYLENDEADLSMASDWVRKNVLKGMKYYNPTKDMKRFDYDMMDQDNHEMVRPNDIRDRILEFTYYDESDPASKEPIEFWGYYSSYDWVTFCWLWGGMIDLPAAFPMYCRDLKQIIDMFHINKDHIDTMVKQEDEHHALADARWNKRVFDYITPQLQGRPMYF